AGGRVGRGARAPVRADGERGWEAEGLGREVRAAGEDRVRGGRHLAQRHLREGVPGHLRARREPGVLPELQRGGGGGRGEAGRGGAQGGHRRGGGLLHLVPEG